MNMKILNQEKRMKMIYLVGVFYLENKINEGERTIGKVKMTQKPYKTLYAVFLLETFW